MVQFRKFIVAWLVAFSVCSLLAVSALPRSKMPSKYRTDTFNLLYWGTIDLGSYTPTASISNITSNPDFWVGKEVSIEAKLYYKQMLDDWNTAELGYLYLEEPGKTAMIMVFCNGTLTMRELLYRLVLLDKTVTVVGYVEKTVMVKGHTFGNPETREAYYIVPEIIVQPS